VIAAREKPRFKNDHTLHGFDSIMKIVRQLRSKVKTPENKSRRYNGDLLKKKTPITIQLNLNYVVTHTLPETVYNRQNMSREKKISAKEQMNNRILKKQVRRGTNKGTPIANNTRQ
jgi:hypothetical protein